jgi:ribosomal-protein-serine acetyltransferase
MPTVTNALFTWPLGDDLALLLRTAAIAEAQCALVEANYKRLAPWFPDAYQEPPKLDEVRANLDAIGRAWLDGSVLPLAIAVKADDGWRLVGWAQMEFDAPGRAEVGYWLDAEFVGRGLVTRVVTAMLDHAFGTLGLDRVGLQTLSNNTRSRSVAERLGFTEDGVLREYVGTRDGRRDLVFYSLLAREWRRSAS